MTRNMSFDIASVIISLFMLIIFSMHKKSPIQQTRFFITLIITNMITAAFNLAYGITCLNMQFNVIISETLITGYYVTHLMCAPLMALYILSYGSNWHDLGNRMKTLFTTPFAIGEILIIANPFTGFIFTFSEDGAYTRNIGLYVIYGIAAFYFAYPLYRLIRYKKRYLPHERRLLFVMMAFTICAIAFQFLFPDQLVESCAITLSEVMIFLTVQNPNDLTDTPSGAYSSRVFLSVMDMYFTSERNFMIIQVIVDDYVALVSAFGVQLSSAISKEIVSFLDSLEDRTSVFRTDSNVFTMVVPYSSRKKSDSIAELIRSRFTHSWSIEGNEMVMSARCCILNCPSDAANIDELTNFLGCFARSKNGMRICRARDINVRSIERERAVGKVISDALNSDKTDIVYLPIYSTVENCVVAAEALMRIYDSSIGFIEESELKEALEKSDDAPRFIEAMLEKICRFVSEEKLADKGIAAIVVRVLSVQCIQPDFILRMAEIKNKYNVPDKLICCTIDEDIVASAGDSFTENASLFSKHGISFALSEYGTGYTNLSKMCELPFECIILDKSIIKDSVVNRKAYTTLSCTYDLLKDLGMEVMAEGIDDGKTYAAILDMNPNFIMGSSISTPLSEGDFIKFIASSGDKALFGGDTDEL